MPIIIKIVRRRKIGYRTRPDRDRIVHYCTVHSFVTHSRYSLCSRFVDVMKLKIFVEFSKLFSVE